MGRVWQGGREGQVGRGVAGWDRWVGVWPGG